MNKLFQLRRRTAAGRGTAAGRATVGDHSRSGYPHKLRGKVLWITSVLAIVASLVYPAWSLGAAAAGSDQAFARALQGIRAQALGSGPGLSLYVAQEGALLRSARQVSGKFAPNPEGLEDILDPSLLAILPAEKFRELFREYYLKHGRAVSVFLASKENEFLGSAVLSFERGVFIKITLQVSPRTGKITGLRLGEPVRSYGSIQGVVDEMKKFPGSAGLSLTWLGPASEVLYYLNPDAALALGSTFKLYILALLVEDRRPWDEVLRIREDLKSLPSGKLQAWPAGSPITVHTLASLMISISDNTATDHLLDYVGRHRVEAMLWKLGNRNFYRSIPFLSTLEMFKLKSRPEFMRRYLEADEAGKRGILGELKTLGREGLGWSKPTAVDSIEWFASPSDLCRLMDHFHVSGRYEEALKIMAINPGLDVPREIFPYAGYKGGSEPGVINMTWLLRSKGPQAFCLSAGWNNSSAALDDERFVGLMQALIYHLASEVGREH
ncbi:MAG: serine hydrolase [Elusimicrobia bacterium]|nr:serine hydrolase [Elusimicrobiota bacterium]